MALIDPRVLAPLTPYGDRCRDDSGMREQPTLVLLGVREGVRASSKPPVRIFLGTEPAQYRAERIFVWSIERVRDPSRVYEIHLMKELAGFDRRRWLTGFTNYRYAIPHFAGGVGRAIWNDVDQIYLIDPGELFDTEMADHGFLTIPRLSSKRRVDSSVMLIDCARMAPVWPLRETQRESSKLLLDRALAVPGLWGDLAPEWNARDEEYEEGQSKLIHYTVLHTQPWQPLPKVFVYQRNAVGQVWYDLERSAGEAGYTVFSASHPSPQYTEMLSRLRRCPSQYTATRRTDAPPRNPEVEGARAPEARIGVRTILEYRLAKGKEDGPVSGKRSSPFGVQSVTRYDPVFPEFAEFPQREGGPVGMFDGVTCTEFLEYLPEEDVPWVIEELFARARRFVYATVSNGPRARTLPDGSRPRSRSGGRSGWYADFEAAGARHPGVHWTLEFHAWDAREGWVRHMREGGPRPAGTPTVWVITDGDPEHADQSLALAEALGWAYELKSVESANDSSPRDERTGAAADSNGVGRASLAPPWPDLIIAEGSRPSRIARGIGTKSRGHTRVVQLGHRGGQRAEPFDIVVTHGHSDLPTDRRRIETVAPLSSPGSERLARAGDPPPSFADAPHPHVVLLVGGSNAHHRLDGKTARRMAEEVRGFAEAASGTAVALTTSRTGGIATEALRLEMGTESGKGTGGTGRVVPWQSTSGEEEGLGTLASADVIVVTGESERLLARAVATGKPVYLYPLPRRRLDPGPRLAQWVEARAHAKPLNRRGTIRPQQGFEYLCARLIERGVVSPPRDMDALHRNLIQRGVALPFGAPLETGRRTPFREADEVARRIRLLLGCPATAAP